MALATAITNAPSVAHADQKATYATRARVEPATVSAAERARVEAFVHANEDSPVSILLRRFLTYTDQGLAVELLSDDAELTPNQASELLKMSRPHLLTFMDRGVLPFHRVGSHRRIKMSDLLTFMEQREAGRSMIAEATHKPLRRRRVEAELSSEELQDLSEL